MDHYELLGVTPASSKAEIAAAFRSKAKSCHPDRNPGDPASAERFIRLQEAYRRVVEGLSKADRKEGPSSIRRRDLRREISIGVEQAIAGTTVRLDGVAGPCGTCDGEGRVRGGRASSCSTCGGSGISGYRERGIIRVKVSCPDCGGSGRTTRVTCSECRGMGSVPHISADIEVPAGCRDGEVLTFAGSASDPDRGLAGDLEVVVRVRAEGGLRISGDDVEGDVAIEIWEAALGAERTLSPPGGGKFKLSIPPGSQHGRKFRLKGHGLGSGEARGDYVAVVWIRIPAAVDPVTRDAFAKLRDALDAKP